MKIPLSWLREFTPVSHDISLTELEDAFVKVGFEVESIDRQGDDITGPLVIGQVLSIEELTGHKKPIRYVGLDCGESETRYVICGATNFNVWDLVVVALPGAVLPGDFHIAARETYGRISNGMICSARELRMSDDHTGIIVLPQGIAALGSNAMELLELQDVVVDLSILADRGYALSARGLARELAASLNLTYSDPAFAVDASKYSTNSAGTQVSIDDPTGASVIYIRSLEEFNPAAPTPMWMRRRLEKCGMRSISLAVDITNYVMLELGQPLHAFDRDHIAESLHIRRALVEQEFVTLDGQTRKLDPDDLLFTDDVKALALAGTMGGLDSEVTASTTRLAVEAARFDPVSIARNSRRHKLSSEASRRFERSVDPRLAEIASARATDLLIEFGGAKHVGSAVSGKPLVPVAFNFDPQFPSRLLGVNIDNNIVQEKLEIVGCAISKESPTSWLVTPPSWRPDLQTPPDLVEEVARLVGLSAIPSQVPVGKSGARLTPSQSRRRILTSLLANNGYAEVMSSPFISPEMMATLGFDGPRARAFRLANPMSEEFPLLRTHLLPGLLLSLQRNLSRGFKNVALFEVGSVFRDIAELPQVPDISTQQRPSESDLETIYASVPYQPIQIAGIATGEIEESGWWGSGRTYQWSDAISMAVNIIEATGNAATIVPKEFAPWHSGRCAEILVGEKVIAHAGELHPRVLKALGLPARTCAFVLLLSEIPFHDVVIAEPVWTMPAAIQDISLIVDQSIPASEVEQALVSGAGELLESIRLFDRYDQLGDGKVSLAYSLVFRAPDRTLTAAEVSQFRESAGESAVAKCGATIRA